jgi:membrane protease YdiL (CAAX protease family)
MSDGISPVSDPMGSLERLPSVDTLPPARTTTKRRDLLELVIGYALLLLEIWAPAHLQRPLFYAAALFIAFVLWTSFRSAQAMGLRTTNLLRSLWIVGIALLLAAVAVVLAIKLHTLHRLDPPIAFLKHYWGYALWSFVQQILLQDFFLGRLLRLIPRAGLAVFATASIFAIAHLPSPVLTVVTFSLGLAACLLFLRYRNLYPLALSHAILGITLAITIPNPIIRNMRVGINYINYTEQHRHHHRNHSDHVASTKAWVRADTPTLRF